MQIFDLVVLSMIGRDRPEWKLGCPLRIKSLREKKRGSQFVASGLRF